MLGDFDLLVLPSYNEGQPIVVLEAMTAGIPVVGTDVGGMAQLITDSLVAHGGETFGPCGVLVTPGDASGHGRRTVPGDVRPGGLRRVRPPGPGPGDQLLPAGRGHRLLQPPLPGAGRHHGARRRSTRWWPTWSPSNTSTATPVRLAASGPLDPVLANLVAIERLFAEAVVAPSRARTPVDELWIPVGELWIPIHDPGTPGEATWVPVDELWIPVGELWIPILLTGDAIGPKATGRHSAPPPRADARQCAHHGSDLP